MIKEVEDKKYNNNNNNFKVFQGLPLISKKIMTINKTEVIKSNEEFEVTYVDNKTLTMKNDGLEAIVGSTYDFPYSIRVSIF